MAVTGVNFERSMIGVFAATKRDIEEMVKFCHETKRDSKSMLEDPLIRNRLVEFAIELEAVRQWSYYIALLQSKGKKVPGEASAVKYTISEAIVRLANFAVETMGLCGTIKRGSKWNPRITYIPQPEPLGLAHAVATAREFLGTSPFLMFRGDNLIKDGVKPFIQKFNQSKPDALILLKEVVYSRAFGVAEFNDRGELICLSEKPPGRKSGDKTGDEDRKQCC